MTTREIRKDGDRTAVQIVFPEDEKIRTKQAFAEECDINNIMKTWRTSGEVHHLNKRAPTWGDFSSVPDYQSAQTQLIEADQAFASMPAKTRLQFNNNPGELLAFVSDPENLEACYDLDLIDRPPKPPRGDPDPPALAPGAAEPDPSPPQPEPTATPISGGD